MAAWSVDRIAALILHESADVVYLYAEKMAQACREKRCGDIVFDERFNTSGCQACSD